MKETISTIQESCTLCGHDVTAYPIRDGESVFCCPGCQAVYHILENHQQLEQYQDHPVFTQAVKSGLISNPDLLEQIRQKNGGLSDDSSWEKLHLEIREMWCPSCAEIIRLLLLQEKGVKNCIVDYTTDLAAIEFSPRYLSKEKILTIIRSLGYDPQLLHERQKKAVSFSLNLRFIIAAFCSLNIMMFAYPLYVQDFGSNQHDFGMTFVWLSFFLSLPVLGYCAFPIYQRFFNSMRIGYLGMETLVVIGISASLLVSLHSLFRGGTHVYFDSMSVIITFVLLGKIIEARAKFSTKDALLRLALAVPRRGRKRLENGVSAFVLMKEIKVGDEILVLTGEKIVLDGVVIEGKGLCDESLMTGESVPITKTKGCDVVGGTILQHGQLAFQVTRSPDETALHKILEMVQCDMGHKTSYVRAADAVVRGFVPFVIAFAFVVGLSCFFFSIHNPNMGVVETAWMRAIAVMLISCPCAVGIAAPIAESGVINGMAKLGAILRNRGCMPYLGHETVVVFDKTGTLTDGCFQIVDGMAILTFTDKTVLKGMTARSTHPIAKAIYEAIKGKENFPPKIEEFAGKGIRAHFDSECYLLGSQSFLREQGVEISPVLDHPLSCVGFAKSGELLTILYLGDRVKPEAKELVEAFHNVKTVLLSGDHHNVVKKVAEQCGIDEWYAHCSPLEKREFIEQQKKKGEWVVMVGDGINDAPALTSAHIGISVVSATDISIQVSDLLLTTERLTVLIKLRELAVKGQRVIKQNLFWAFFYNTIGIGLAAWGSLTPLYSASAMVVSSLIVIFNARRISSSAQDK